MTPHHRTTRPPAAAHLRHIATRQAYAAPRPRQHGAGLHDGPSILNSAAATATLQPLPLPGLAASHDGSSARPAQPRPGDDSSRATPALRHPNRRADTKYAGTGPSSWTGRLLARAPRSQATPPATAGLARATRQGVGRACRPWPPRRSPTRRRARAVALWSARLLKAAHARSTQADCSTAARPTRATATTDPKTPEVSATGQADRPQASPPDRTGQGRTWLL